jgi:hypothetical protein
VKFQDLKNEHMHHQNIADKLHEACDRTYTVGAFEIRVSTDIPSHDGHMNMYISHPNYGMLHEALNNRYVPTQVLAVALAIKRWHEDWVAGQKPELPVALGPIIESMGGR